jgi:4-hydroxy-tetrahydrodipicolinate reductase
MRLVLVGTGLIARSLLTAAREQGHAVVGAVDVDPAKVGRDVGEVLGLEAEGVAIVAGVDDVRGAADVAVVATSSHLETAAPTLLACLRRGWNVVSTCEELAYPWRTHPALATELDAAAAAAGVTLVGAGINPGFVLDTLVLVATAPCTTVRAVRGLRVLDAATRRASFRDKVGVGLTPEAFAEASARPGFGHAGLRESAWLVADRIGLPARRVRESIEPVLDADGARVLGSHQVATLLDDAGDEVVRLEMVMAAGAADPRDVIELDADPPLRLVVDGGTPGDAGTAGVTLNTARRLAEAGPGLRTMDELPIPHAVAPSLAPAAI